MPNKKKAVKAFQSQRDKLNTLGKDAESAWKSYTTQLARKYLGENNDLTKEIEAIKFYSIMSFIGFSSTRDTEWEREEREKKKLEDAKEYRKVAIERAIQLLNACIDYVNEQGVFNPPKFNFLHRLHIGVIVSLGVTIFGAGMGLGKLWADLAYSQVINGLESEKSELKRKVELLELSISSPKVSTTEENIISDSIK